MMRGPVVPKVGASWLRCGAYAVSGGRAGPGAVPYGRVSRSCAVGRVELHHDGAVRPMSDYAGAARSPYVCSEVAVPGGEVHVAEDHLPCFRPELRHLGGREIPDDLSPLGAFTAGFLLRGHCLSFRWALPSGPERRLGGAAPRRAVGVMRRCRLSRRRRGQGPPRWCSAARGVPPARGCPPPA